MVRRFQIFVSSWKLSVKPWIYTPRIQHVNPYQLILYCCYAVTCSFHLCFVSCNDNDVTITSFSWQLNLCVSFFSDLQSKQWQILRQHIDEKNLQI